MGFEEFIPENIRNNKDNEIGDSRIEKVTQSHVYDVIVSKKPDWQVIIYDLISSEQLDPWDIDIILLTNKYFEKILELDDLDFYISSKVLLASALLLRIKSEFLLNKHVRSIDEILFGKKEENKQVIERIEIDESELPILIPKTPLPRLRKVTLNELMEALNIAINTESRRIKREVAIKRARKLSHVDIPKFRKLDLKDRIKEFYARVLTALSSNDKLYKKLNKISFNELIGKEKEQKLGSFLPLLHLSNANKLWLEQKSHLDEIWIYLFQYFKKNKNIFIEELEEDIEDMKEELESDNAENIDEKKSGLEIARKKRNEKKILEEEIRKELENELGRELNEIIEEASIIEEEKIKEEKIDEISGFDDELV